MKISKIREFSRYLVELTEMTNSSNENNTFLKGIVILRPRNSVFFRLRRATILSSCISRLNSFSQQQNLVRFRSRDCIGPDGISRQAFTKRHHVNFSRQKLHCFHDEYVTLLRLTNPVVWSGVEAVTTTPPGGWGGDEIPSPSLIPPRIKLNCDFKNTLGF